MTAMHIPYETPYCDESDGCTGGGGGGGSSSLFQIGGPNPSVNLADTVIYIIEWSDTFFGGAANITRGTEVSWDSGTPTIITINTDGFYDINYLATLTPGTDPAAFQSGLLINGAIFIPGAVFPEVGIVENGTPAPASTAGFTILSVELSAGDELSVQINQTGNASDDTSLAYAAIQVARRA